MATVAERVERGIRLLDEKGPKDWRQKVVVRTLNMASQCKCVLGQVFGNFSLGRDEIVRDDFAADCGFDCDDFDGEQAGDRDFDELQEEWTRRLTEPQ